MPPRQRLILALLIPLILAAMYFFGLLGSSGVDPNAMSSWRLLAGNAPIYVALMFAWQTEKSTLDFFQPELMGVYGWWISLVNGYIVGYMLTFTGVLPSPEVAQFATANLLNVSVNYPATAIILGTIVFFIWFLFRRNGLAAKADRIQLPARRVVLLALLAVLASVIFMLGGTDFGFALLPSVWFWIHIVPRADRWGKYFNMVLGVGGMAFPLVYGTIALVQGSWWRLVTAAVYGRLTPLEVLLFLFWVALFARFVRLGWSEPYVPPQGGHTQGGQAQPLEEGLGLSLHDGT